MVEPGTILVSGSTMIYGTKINNEKLSVQTETSIRHVNAPWSHSNELVINIYTQRRGIC